MANTKTKVPGIPRARPLHQLHRLSQVLVPDIAGAGLTQENHRVDSGRRHVRLPQPGAIFQSRNPRAARMNPGATTNPPPITRATFISGFNL